LKQKQGWRNLNGVGMNTKEMSGEQISALADGEIADDELESALASLRKEDALGDWAIYHQIGDVLRSDDMALNMSTDFNARFAARLAAEPTIIAPAAHNASNKNITKENRGRDVKRWALPGMAAAVAMAAVAFVSTPQLMVAMSGSHSSSGNNAVMASAGKEQPSNAAGSASIVAASASGEVVMRDARIDDYLLAHQRFSPSLYSTTQYARSATFATDSTK